VLSMSKQEFSRLEVLLRVQSGRLRVEDACALIGLHCRQVFRLLRGLRQDGATSLLSKRRGKPSNHRLPPDIRTLALSIVRERYADFGPAFAAEALAELHGCSVSSETLRGWMIADGLWTDRRHRLASPHQTRRPLTAADNLDEILAWREERPVTRNLTLRYDGMLLCWTDARKKVEVVNYPDGRFAVQFEGTPLPFRVFDKIQTMQPSATVKQQATTAVRTFRIKSAAPAISASVEDSFGSSAGTVRPAALDRRPPSRCYINMGCPSVKRVAIR